MKSYPVVALIGTLCLPATYSFTRDGHIVLTGIIVVALGCIAGLIVQFYMKNGFHPGRLIMAFTAGIMVSELIAFGYYFLNYGYQDSKLYVGMSIATIEFLVISIVGSVALLAAVRITQNLSAK
ncbi:MAG: hypothetical protein Tsb0027_24110 [Wenzhouxiangellaceae bacterium]